jgi:CRISPR/Cas system CMR subunit Cmr6 (Cas7 group RAMP superfamily)
MEVPEFVEIEFSMPFYEIYFETGSDLDNQEPNPIIFLQIAKYLSINFDADFLYNKYVFTQINQGDIYIYLAKNENIFLFFDLYKPADDQMAMIRIGFRIRSEDLTIIKEKLMEIYFRSPPRSAFQEDYFNQNLLRIKNNLIPNSTRIIHIIK